MGSRKTALEMIIEEVYAAGIESIAIVLRPGDEEAYRQAAGQHLERLVFLPQAEPRGYGDALLQAKDYAAGQPVLHLVGDHLYLSQSDKRCAQQLIEVATKEKCSVSAVQATRETMLPFFGAVGGSRVPQEERLYEVKRVAEKPTPTMAEQHLTVAGFRSGYYLCFFGMHVLSPTVMEILAKLSANQERNVPLSKALHELASRERYLALEIEGTRYNIGAKYGLLMTQLAFALAGNDRHRILSEMVELLASR